MAGRQLITTFGLLLASALTAPGDVAQLRALQTAQREVATGLEALGVQRVALVERADSLSDLISRLKRSDSESTELGETILSTMALVRQLVTIDQAMDTMSARGDSLTEQLRSAYDWEISTLIKSLSEELDEGLLDQLIIFQDERHALGEDAMASRMRYPVEMVVEATDGPDEIRQKIDLLDGKSGLMRNQLARVESRIRQLEEESRMASKMRNLAGKLWAMESPLQTARGQSLGEVRPRPDVAVMTPTTETRGQEWAAPPVSVLPTPHYILLEIRKLHTRREELRQMRVVVDERIGAFRLHLRELLDGRQ